MPAVVEKCFGAMRAGTKKSAVEVAMLYAEMEDTMGCEGLVTDLLAGTGAKQPKVVACAVATLAELFRDFGPRQVSFKLILKKLPTLFGHSDKTVRSEAGTLAQELHKWVGPALEPTIASLKEIQAKELHEQFAELDRTGQKHTKPTRFLISQKPAEEETSPAGADDGNGGGGESGQGEAAEDDIDPLEFAEPVNPLKAAAWPENLDEMLASKKWLERKEVLDQCLKVLEGTPKIIHTPPIDTFVDELAEKVKKDANINVALVSAQCIAKLAMGLQANFAKNKDKVLPPLLEKLKERKEAVVKVLNEALDAVFQTVSFGEILEHVLNFTKHKNPSVKTGTIQYLVRCLQTTRQMPAKADIKPIADALLSASADGSADVRDAGAQGLGTLMKLIGERPMNQFIDGLDDIRKAKIQEQFKIATVKVKAGGGAPARSAAPPPAASSAPKPKPKPSAAPVAKKPAAPPVADKENAPPKAAASPAPTRAAPPARLMAKRPAPASASAGPSKPAAATAPFRPIGAKGAGGAKAPSATEPVKYRFHQEDAEAKAADLIPEAIATQLASGVWKERLTGMQELNQWLKVEAAEVESEIIIRSLSKKPGWKESNFQVMAEVYSAMRLLADDSPSFARASASLSMAPLCEKLGDMKLKAPAGETLTLFAEKTSFGFVLAQALSPLSNVKAPKAIADSLLWVNQAILDFGTQGVDVRGVIEYLLTCLKSANAAVRTNATTVIGTLARFLGTALTTFLGDLNPQLRSTIEAEIEKATINPPPAPTRFSGESRPTASAGAESNGNGTGAAGAPEVDEDALDALIPRVDLDKLVAASSIAKIGDANWKERKDGLDEVIAILDANTRLKSNMNELGTALKMRYTDSNIQVRTLALDALAKIATAMNKGFDQHVRTFVPSVTQVLADAKAPIRAAASKTLTAMAEQVGVGNMIAGFGTVLDSKAANPMLKQDLFTWLGEWFEAHPPEKGMDLTPLALPVVVTLDDKLAAVRKAAQSVLPFIIMRAGYKFVMEQTNGLKTASRNTVIPLIDAAKSQAAAKTPKAAPVASAAAAAAPSRPTASKMPPPPPVESLPPLPAAAKPAAGAVPRSSVKPPTAVGRSLKAPSTASRPQSVLTSRSSDDNEAPSPRSATRAKFGAPAKKSAFSSFTAQVAPDRSVPLITADGKFKAIREKKEGRAAHWIGPEGTPRPELVEVLRQQCEHHLSVDIIDQMFSKDHNAERDFSAALTLFSDFISSPTFAEEQFGLSHQETLERAVANSDLIFKYIAIRLTDNNTSISLKCLDVLDHLVNLLRGERYHLLDYEANSLLPCLIAKFGDPKVAFRDRIRDIFRRMAFIYPPSKLLTFYVDVGLPSKNARVRTECLGELGHLIAKNGLQVCSPAKTLPIVAKQIADRDNGVRTAALMALGEGYKIIGEDIYKYVGSLPPKDMSLLQERLKRTEAPSSKAPVAAPPTPTAGAGPRASIAGASKIAAASSRIARPPSGIPGAAGGPAKSRLPGPASGIARPASLAHRSVPSSEGTDDRPASPSARLPRGIPRPSTNGASARSSASIHEDEEELEAAPPSSYDAKTSASNEDDVAVEQAINEILSSDCDRSVMALKHVEQEIQAVAPALIRHADQLAIVFGKQLHRAFTSEQSAPGDRLKKHLLVTGTSIFDNTRLWDDPKSRSAEDQGKTLGSFVSRPALVSLLTELLQRLIETSGATDEETQTYGRYLNIIVLRSFSSCNLNVLFGACLTMLTEATEDMDQLQDAMLKKRSKFAELITKCLWKITRKLPTSLQEELLEPQQLLVDVENFLQATPPKEWKRRASEDVPLGEMPLRTIKVILTHLGSIYGEEALGMLDGLQDPEQSHVYAYLLRIIDRGQGSGLDVDEDEISTAGGGEGARSGGSEHTGSSLSHVSRRSAASPPMSPSKLHIGAPQSPFVSARAQSSAVMSPSMVSSPSGDSISAGGAESGVNAELRAIFDRIASKSESRAAIKDLYLFQRRYPHKEASIQRSLEKTGPIFQKFIKRALANHAAEDEDNSLVSTPQARTLSMISGHGGPSEVGSPGSLSARSSMAFSAAPEAQQQGQTGQRTSFRSSIGGGDGGTTAPNSPSSQRSSVTDDRLAQLRAKFSRTPSSSSTGPVDSSSAAPMSPPPPSHSSANRTIPRPVSRIPGASNSSASSQASAATRSKLMALRNGDAPSA